MYVLVYLCILVFLGEGHFFKKNNDNNNNNKGICAPKSKLANISLFKEFVGDTI